MLEFAPAALVRPCLLDMLDLLALSPTLSR
jgi:hypothetical protein